MNSARVCLLSASLVLASLALSRDERVPQESEGGLATLYVHDDLQSSFDFRRGRAGGRVEDGEIRLADAQLVFGAFAAGRMSVGFVHDEYVSLLDLGEAYVTSEVRARDLAEEFAITVFHTLTFDGTRFSFVGPGDDVRPLERADRILDGVPPEGMRHVAPLLGHTYLLRVRHKDAGDEFFKFQVVGLVAEHSLTIRWARVPRS